MVSSFTTNKSLEKPANGDYVDTWNVPVNGDMDVIDQALGGTTFLNATGGSATLSVSQYRAMALSISGAMSGNITYTIPSGIGGSWIVFNNTTDATGGPWSVTIASAGGGTSVVVRRGFNTTVYSDGTNIRLADNSATAGGSDKQVQFNQASLFGGSANFVFDYTNSRVGIGTSSPATQLHLTTTGSNSIFRIGDNSSGTYPSLQMFAGAGYYNWLISAQNNVSDALEITPSTGVNGSTFSTPVLVITQPGNIGVGTNSPSAKLNVVANTSSDAVRITQTGAGNAFVVEDSASADSSPFIIDSSGNVAIGTTTLGLSGLSMANNYNIGWPQVSGQNIPNIFRQTSSGALVMAYGYGYSATANGFASSFSSSLAKAAVSLAGNIIFYTDSAATTAVGTDVTPTERMRILTTGNIGIGTASPQAPLDIAYTNDTRAPTLRLTNNNTGGFGPQIEFYGAYSGGYTFAKIGAENNSGTGGSFLLSVADTTKTLQSRMIVLANGNTGIGTTGPTTRLEVSGTIYSNTGGYKFPDGSTQTTAIPIGGIIMWSGSIASIPTSWALCNGANGTPDLRDRFIVGAGSAYAVGATGGANTVTLSTSEMPSHTHNFSATTSTDGTHTHGISDPGHRHFTDFAQTTSGGTYVEPYPVAGSYASLATTYSTTGISINSAGAHTHSVSGTTSSAGTTGAHENRPPYYALAYIMRIA